MSFRLVAERRRRRMSLTPMIDVVFLLLVFFMLAARFGLEGSVAVSAAGAGDYSGPPRLVEVLPAGLRLNGVAVGEAGLAAALAPLVSGPGDLVVLRAREGADTQRVVDVMEALARAGFARLALVD